MCQVFIILSVHCRKYREGLSNLFDSKNPDILKTPSVKLWNLSIEIFIKWLIKKIVVNMLNR